MSSRQKRKFSNASHASNARIATSGKRSELAENASLSFSQSACYSLTEQVVFCLPTVLLRKVHDYARVSAQIVLLFSLLFIKNIEVACGAVILDALA